MNDEQAMMNDNESFIVHRSTMFGHMWRQSALALFLLCFGTYAWFYQGGGWNQNSRFDLTRAIVERGTVRIDGYEQNTGDTSFSGGHYYCDKAPGVSFLCAPP